MFNEENLTIHLSSKYSCHLYARYPEPPTYLSLAESWSLHTAAAARCWGLACGRGGSYDWPRPRWIAVRVTASWSGLAWRRRTRGPSGCERCTLTEAGGSGLGQEAALWLTQKLVKKMLMTVTNFSLSLFLNSTLEILTHCFFPHWNDVYERREVFQHIDVGIEKIKPQIHWFYKH